MFDCREIFVTGCEGVIWIHRVGVFLFSYFFLSVVLFVCISSLVGILS